MKNQQVAWKEPAMRNTMYLAVLGGVVAFWLAAGAGLK